MRAKLYEKYYKLGFDHCIFKDVMGLRKPNKVVKRFYYVLIFGVVIASYALSIVG